jgi:hypothetical protein
MHAARPLLAKVTVPYQVPVVHGLKQEPGQQEMFAVILHLPQEL